MLLQEVVAEAAAGVVVVATGQCAESQNMRLHTGRQRTVATGAAQAVAQLAIANR